MPLSEHEQRVLNELEQSLRQADPAFAKKVRETTVYRAAGRRVRWAALGFVVGLIVLLATFTANQFLGLTGVVLMFVSAVVMERNVRRLGRASLLDLGLTSRARAATEGVENATPSWARWIRRPTDEV